MDNNNQVMGPDSDSNRDIGVREWNVINVERGEIAVPPKYEFKGSIISGSYENIDQDSSIVFINNQSYYMTTIHKTLHSLVFDPPHDAKEANKEDANGTAFKFCDVTFTFLYPPAAPGIGGVQQFVLVEFPDRSTEMLPVKDNVASLSFQKGGPGDYLPDGTHVFPDGTEYGVSSAVPTVTTLGEHISPKAGLTITSDSVKLLVSVQMAA